MKRLVSAILATVLLLTVAGPALAAKSSSYDLCSNIDGIQSRVPHGMVLRISTSGDLICVPK